MADGFDSRLRHVAIRVCLLLSVAVLLGACSRGPQPEPFEEVIAFGSLEGPTRPIPWDLRWLPLGDTDYFALFADRSEPGFVGVGMEFRSAALEEGLAVWYLIMETNDEASVMAAVGFVRQGGDVDRVLAYFDGLDEPLRLEMIEAPNGTADPVQLVYGVAVGPRFDSRQPDPGPYLCAASFDAVSDVVAVDTRIGDSDRCPVATGPSS